MQKDVFFGHEGDAWYGRNRAKLDVAGKSDPVLAVLKTQQLESRSLLEIGCSNGWRVSALARDLGAAGFGLDPSAQAIADGQKRHPNITLKQGAADSLPFGDAQFDLVIYGFCLYLCDREDLMRISAEGDRVLSDGGHLVVYDFDVTTPYRRIYHHDPRMNSYKMDHSVLFLRHPGYSLVTKASFDLSGGAATNDDETVAVTVMKKDMRGAFPLRSG